MPDAVQNIKRYLRIFTSPRVSTALLIILVGLASFGMGRLSALQEERPPVRIFGDSAAMAVSRTTGTDGTTTISGESGDEQNRLPALDPGGKYVGSKNGRKYHFPWCPGAQRIAEENKVWFNSVEEARAAGYDPASNCKGLE